MPKQSDMPGALALAGAAILIAGNFLWPAKAELRAGEIQRAVEAQERVAGPVRICSMPPADLHPRQPGHAQADGPTRLEFALLCRPDGDDLAEEGSEGDDTGPNLAYQPQYPLHPHHNQRPLRT